MMSIIKWIKISISMFDDEKIKIINSYKNKDSIIIIWLKLLLQAGKSNDGGYIFPESRIVYTKEMLALIFDRECEEIELALDVLSAFEMIEITEDNRIRIVNWDKHQNIEGMERARELSKMRMRKKRMKDRENLEKFIDSNNFQEQYDENVTDESVTVT